MRSKNDKPNASMDGEGLAKLSYWEILVAEGFVPARLPKPMIVREGHPEVPLNR